MVVHDIRTCVDSHVTRDRGNCSPILQKAISDVATLARTPRKLGRQIRVVEHSTTGISAPKQCPLDVVLSAGVHACFEGVSHSVEYTMDGIGTCRRGAVYRVVLRHVDITKLLEADAVGAREDRVVGAVKVCGANKTLTDFGGLRREC